jgi:hypothetical protein
MSSAVLGRGFVRASQNKCQQRRAARPAVPKVSVRVDLDGTASAFIVLLNKEDP